MTQFYSYRNVIFIPNLDKTSLPMIYCTSPVNVPDANEIILSKDFPRIPILYELVP